MSPEKQKEKRKPQTCSFCKNHGYLAAKKDHKAKCTFKDCHCNACQEVKDRQKFAAEEKRRHYRSSKNEVDVKEEGRQRKPQKCRKCKNHDLTIPMRDHKRHCKFIDCKCSACILTISRRDRVTKEAKSKRQREKVMEIKSEDNSMSSSSESFTSMSPRSNFDTASVYPNSPRDSYASDESEAHSPQGFPMEEDEQYTPNFEALGISTPQSSPPIYQTQTVSINQTYFQSEDSWYYISCHENCYIVDYPKSLLLSTQNLTSLPHIVNLDLP